MLSPRTESVMLLNISQVTSRSQWTVICQSKRKLFTSAISPLRCKCIAALNTRIRERRFEFADLFTFLANPSMRATLRNNFGIFSKTTRNVLIKQADELLERLTAGWECEPQESETQLSDVYSIENDAKLTMKEKFEKRLQQFKAAPVSKNSSTQGFHKTLRAEFTYLETEGLKGKFLTMLFEALSTVRPTSVDSERAFSVSGNFVTKIRSRMEDDTLNVLCILKDYFCTHWLRSDTTEDSLIK